jgi:hypothetical protein
MQLYAACRHYEEVSRSTNKLALLHEFQALNIQLASLRSARSFDIKSYRTYKILYLTEMLAVVS